MMTVCKYLAAVVAVVALTGPALGQSSRYELGLRLRGFEKVWADHITPEGRRRVAPLLIKATPYFFTGRLGEAGQMLDLGAHAILGDEPSAARKWAESLAFDVRRLLDTSAASLQVNLRQFYTTEAQPPAQAKARFTLLADGRPVAPSPWMVPVPEKLPGDVTLDLKGVPPGDHTLRMEILAGDQVLASGEQTVSFAKDLSDRLAAVAKKVEELPATEAATQTETVRRVATLVRWLAEGSTLETDYPAARLLRETEAALAAVRAGEAYYGPQHTGQFWLQLVTGGGQETVRVLVPDEAKKGQPLPLVIALHGVGGSENLFFDAHGNGEIVDLCRRRGWLLVAPRTSGIAFRSPAGAIIEELARLYPVDKTRVFIVGHSMGAGQAMYAVQSHPEYFRGAALLSGSGAVRQDKKIRDIGFFVGVGDRDFALEGSRRLAHQLKQAGVATVEFREYPSVEHVMTVPVALPEVFAFFDRLLKQ